MYLRHVIKEHHVRNDADQVDNYMKIRMIIADPKLYYRDPEMISITSAPEAPPPRIRILDNRAREVETVRIGDKLTFRIEIPEDSKTSTFLSFSMTINLMISAPYGIFARSCVAMAKDSKSTFQIIDDEGCPVDPSIFPSFTPDGNALQSIYEAFRFTESYGVIFQCNVKYCLGPCEPVSGKSYGWLKAELTLLCYRLYANGVVNR